MSSFRRRHRILALALPFAMYGGLSIALFVGQADWPQNYLGTGADAAVDVWFLRWWPFAVSHALNPFVSDYVWHPGGIVVPWYDAVPSAALFAWPITWLIGPILAYNLLSLLAPALSAWSAFLLTRY